MRRFATPIGTRKASPARGWVPQYGGITLRTIAAGSAAAPTRRHDDTVHRSERGALLPAGNAEPVQDVLCPGRPYRDGQHAGPVVLRQGHSFRQQQVYPAENADQAALALPAPTRPDQGATPLILRLARRLCRKRFNQLSLAPAAAGPMASRKGLRRQLALDFPHFPLAWLSPSHSLEKLSEVMRGRLLGYHQMTLRHTGVLAGARRRMQFGEDCTSTPIAMIRLMRERAKAIYRRDYECSLFGDFVGLR
jgi:hypothetical protein